MDLIKEVKERANILKVAKYFGMELNKSGKCLCPFHMEKTPSLSISDSKQIWKCFGCGKGGDVINLVEELLNINAYEAAKKINIILNLGFDVKNNFLTGTEVRKNISMIKRIQGFEVWKNDTFQALCDYLHLLFHLEEKYKPINPKDEINRLYVRALQQKEKVEYYLELMINGNDDDIIWFWQTERKKIEKLKIEIKLLKGEI